MHYGPAKIRHASTRSLVSTSKVDNTTPLALIVAQISLYVACDIPSGYTKSRDKYKYTTPENLSTIVPFRVHKLYVIDSVV